MFASDVDTQTQISPHTKPIFIHYSAPDFDGACHQARLFALDIYGADDNGYLHNVEGFERARDAVVVEFVKYQVLLGMDGATHQYEFSAWIDWGETDEEG